MYGQQWLRQRGWRPNQDYVVKGVRTDLGVGRMLLTGEAVAAIMSNGEFRSLPAEESARLKVVETFARIPNFVVLGHPRVGREQLAKLKTELKDFLADKDEGAAFKQATGFAAIVDADESQLRELDAYTAPTRRAMGWCSDLRPEGRVHRREERAMSERRPATDAAVAIARSVPSGGRLSHRTRRSPSARRGWKPSTPAWSTPSR